MIDWENVKNSQAILWFGRRFVRIFGSKGWSRPLNTSRRPNKVKLERE
ncbi:hypothetical protein HMPREF9374_2042 [Desmospora sp. 8437]|nr:hypothetical protein HMPREF9374_2042 [Desmospora sp. 8437]